MGHGSVIDVTTDRRNDRRRAAVIVNPVKVDQARLRDSVERAAMAASWGPTDWYETTPEDSGQRVTALALKAGASVVLAAGGDGTVRAVAEALRGSGIPLAVAPSGTGNLLARNLGLPLNSLDASAALAFTGAERAIDLGIARAELGGETAEREFAFLVMAGMGIDAAMIANTSSALKKRVGWLAYVDGGVRSLPKLRQLRLRFAIDGGVPRGARISTILVANCGRLPGNIDLFPGAEPDDGLLDVAVMQPKSLFGWLLIWRRVMWENRVLRRSALGRSLIRFSGSEDKRTITYLAGTEVTITVRDPQPFELDGDAIGSVTELRFTVEPGALLVKVPQPARTPTSAAEDARAISTE